MKMKLKVMSVLLLFGVFALFILSSCVDMPTKGPTPPAALSYYRFINADAGLGSISLSVDGNAIGTLDFKANTSYGEYNAGTRRVVFSTGDTLYAPMSTDYRGTFCIVKEGSDITLFKANEMRVFDPMTGEKGKLRMVHVSPDAPAVDIQAMGPDTLDWHGIGYKSVGGYQDATPGEYAVSVTPVDSDSPVLTFNVTVGTERSSAFIVGSVAGATLSAVALKDN